MEKGYLLKIIYLKEIDSTHKYLIENLKNNNISTPIAIVSDIQTNGFGSRGNSWDSLEGNLFLSFSLNIDDLPNDLPLQSTSIYFSYI